MNAPSPLSSGPRDGPLPKFPELPPTASTLVRPAPDSVMLDASASEAEDNPEGLWVHEAAGFVFSVARYARTIPLC